MSNTGQTEQDLSIFTHTYMQQQLMKKEAVTLKEARRGLWEGLRVGKGREKWCNYLGHMGGFGRRKGKEK